MVTLGNDPVWQIMLDRLSLSVAEGLPFSLTAGAAVQSAFEERRNHGARHPDKTRRLERAVEILLEQPPRGVNGQQEWCWAGDQTKVDFRLAAESNAAPGKYEISFTARNRDRRQPLRRRQNLDRQPARAARRSASRGSA